MSRSTPSLLALLGLVAYAGYQNRDKIGEMLKDGRLGQTPEGAPEGAGTGFGSGFLAEIGNLFQSRNPGGALAGGLGQLVDRFRTAGHGQAADSWVTAGANQPIPAPDLEHALGDDTLAELEQKTGLSREELLHRLSASLPDVVDQLTPEGRLPADPEAGRPGMY